MAQKHTDTLQYQKTFRTAAVCFLFSGATALIYEVLWARMLGLVFGATTIAISAVLAAFMGGLAVGSMFGGRLSRKLANPLRAYALIEISIGLYALVVPLLFRLIDSVYGLVWQRFHPGFYGFALSRFVLAAIVLFVPTALMGATLPVLVAAIRTGRDSPAANVARLYTLNLGGAIVGTVAAGFFLLPAFGVRMTIWIAAAVNLLIGLAVLSTRPEPIKADAGTQRDLDSGAPDVEDPGGQSFWFACAFVSGLVTISMQVVWSRLLSMIIGSSTYAFTIVLALFLFSLALGSWIVSKKTKPDQESLRRAILLIELLTAATLFLSIRITNLIPSLLVNTGLRIGIDSWVGLLTLQIGVAGLLIIVPAVLMGMVMPLALTWAAHDRVKRIARSSSVGKTYALNTLGAIAGAILTAFILIPGTSTRFAIYCMAALSILIAGAAYQPRSATTDSALRRSLGIGAAVVIMIAMLLIWPRLNLNALSAGAYDGYVRVLAKSRVVPEEQKPDSPADHQLLMFEEGRTATVSVRKDWGITSVAINGRTNASDADDMATQVVAGQLGLLVAPRLDHALMIGFATGVSVGSALKSPLAALECVEIEPAAVTSGRYFDHVNNRPLNDPRLRVVIDDARTVLRVNPTQYDLIISEPSHPWVPGVANLFTREFFTLGSERLRADGVFVQWLQIYQLSTESIRSVLATFAEVYPHVAVFRIQGTAKGKDLILLGSRMPIDLNRISERMKDPRALADLSRVGLKTAADVRAWFVCDESVLRPAVAGAVINTDDNMHIETVAPREAFRATMEQNAAWIESLKTPVANGQ